MIKIKDIYAGKPDAKDEIMTEGVEKFVESYIVPTNFNISELISGNAYFISGYKGTGKTALLYYLEQYTKQIDDATCSSFIFFKNDYPITKREEMETLSKRLVSSISISNDVVLDTLDFEHVWRWLMYQRIYEDNVTFNNGLFIDDSAWIEFEKNISSISKISQKYKLSIPQKIKMATSLNTDGTSTSITPEIELDFTKTDADKSPAYRNFTSIIENLDYYFSQLQRTDIPYYIFIDELEAYYGDQQIFNRDLRLIRDLIITIKKLNTTLRTNISCNTKIICSIRNEIIYAINRFIVSKEVNKVTSGFDVPLVWNYTNTNSFKHPILQILLKRIQLAENKQNSDISLSQIENLWFSEKINRNIDTSHYILNNTWYKPRDIVRLIISAQNSMCGESKKFDQSTFDQLQKNYSRESLIEMQEELKALYTASEIDTILTCLTGFKSRFSFNEIYRHIAKYNPNSFLLQQLGEALSTLYRVGIIGNLSRSTGYFRWQHKGDDTLILNGEWDMTIHHALRPALSLSARSDYSFNRRKPVKLCEGDIVFVTVYNTINSFAFVEFEHANIKYKGSIHISKLSKKYVTNIIDEVSIGDSFEAKIIRFNLEYNQWELTKLI